MTYSPSKTGNAFGMWENKTVEGKAIKTIKFFAFDLHLLFFFFGGGGVR